MSAATLKYAAWSFLSWAASQVGVTEVCELLVTDVRGQIESFLHSRQFTAILIAAGVTLFIHALRSARWGRGTHRETSPYWRSEHGS